MKQKGWISHSLPTPLEHPITLKINTTLTHKIGSHFFYICCIKHILPNTFNYTTGDALTKQQAQESLCCSFSHKPTLRLGS